MDSGKIRILINGFGRIGRAFFRIAINDSNIDIVGINDKNLSTEEIVYLAKYDTVYGVLPNHIELKNNIIRINDNNIETYQSDNLSSLPVDVDIIVYASGDYDKLDAQLNFISTYNCRVIFTSPITHPQIQDFIFGFSNPTELNSKYISLNICDSVAVVPVYNFLRNNYSLESVSIVTLHPYLGYQQLLDGKSGNSDYTLGRSAINNLIPKTTSLESILKSYFPKDDIMVMSYRVPTNAVSGAILNLVSEDKFELNILQSELERQCSESWKVIGLYSRDKCVSIDYLRTPYSFILDHEWFDCVANHARVCLWYDNEWGYAMRIVDMVKMISS